MVSAVWQVEKHHWPAQAVHPRASRLPQKNDVMEHFGKYTVKGSQFLRPLLEFPYACAGCGQTPYAKLVTGLFGERMYIANATGCSSIWGNSEPSTPYCVSERGRGPAWSNSLFEDAAEFGLGMLLSQKPVREDLKTRIKKLSEENISKELSTAVNVWLNTFDNGDENDEATSALVDALKKENNPDTGYILENADKLNKKSFWIFGGDGWAYDIGFGGLDHVLHSGEDINILVFDTECYSNTGGQASKSTPKGAKVKFASSGKKLPQKDLIGYAINIGSVYVASVSMGADMNQCIKAFKEAESFKGSSLIIAYCPCTAHGIKSGMANAQKQELLAVKSGYRRLLRFDPDRRKKGLDPLITDSSSPVTDIEAFKSSEHRYDA